MRPPLARGLIAFPLGLLVAMPIFDLMLFITHDRFWSHVAFWSLTIGVVAGLVALGSEIYEFRHEHPATRPYRMTLFEIGAFLTALTLYLTSWFIRVSVGIVNTDGGEAACSALASVILLAAGWLGGTLVDRLRIGLSEDPTAEAAARRAQRHHDIEQHRV